MRNKRLLRTLSALCLTLVLASGFTVPAFAQGAAPPPAEDTTNDSNVVVEETEKAPPLTPDGNAALVDDFGGNKQLITVTTKAGNDGCFDGPGTDSSPSALICPDRFSCSRSSYG